MIKNNVPSRDEALYRRIEEVVHYIWDPIGVCRQPEARDEYSNYMAGIIAGVKSGKMESIVERLREATINMGLTFNAAESEDIARVMLSWKEFIFDSNE